MFTIHLIFALFFISFQLTSGKGFLRDQNGTAAAQALSEELQVALDEVMGCGGPIDSEHLQAITDYLKPMWKTLPKNSKGKADWRSLRYMTHRYFVQKSSLMIRGFEPLRELNTSDAGILSKQIPHYVDKMLGGKHAEEGFSLQDATRLVATLERLIFDSETHLLEVVYKSSGRRTKTLTDFTTTKQLLENYMVRWLMGDDTEAISMLLRNRTLLETEFPHWHSLTEFVGGRLKALDFMRVRRPSAQQGKRIFDTRYSFDDVHQVVGTITSTFQSFWESECQDMKTQLVAMDKKGTGRVHLADFWGSGLDDDWRFGESEQYLREMGALDESSTWLGKQVIISNYLQASSNCIVTTSHYMLCCSNPCEGILSDIETVVGSAMAAPEDVFDAIRPMTTEDDDPIKMSSALTDQLQRIAEQQGGRIPLHGRLFAQWLHYVFPTECPFPHKVGSVSWANPLEFGDNSIASESDMSKYVKEQKTKKAPSDRQKEVESTLLSQWSEEEELFADYSMEMRAPWEGSSTVLRICCCMLGVGIALAAWLGNGKRTTARFELPLSSKAHLV